MRGFTLIELLIALALVAILVAVALPVYREQIVRSGRGDARVALNQLAQALERHALIHGSYVGADVALYGDRSPQGRYTLTIAVQEAGSAYLLTAVPTPGGGQEGDARCPALTLNHRGEQGAAGGAPAEACWR